MQGLSSITALLKTLPPPVRRAIYVVVTLIGAALAVCQVLGVSDLGPVTLTQALQVYAYLSPAAGVVAVANVSKHGTVPDEEALPAFDEDVDLASFQPVGASSDVYDPYVI